MKRNFLVLILGISTFLGVHTQAQTSIDWSCFSSSGTLASGSNSASYDLSGSACNTQAGAYTLDVTGTGGTFSILSSALSGNEYIRLQKTGTTPVFTYGGFKKTDGSEFSLTGLSVTPTSVASSAGGSQTITVHAYKDGSEVGSVTTGSLSSVSLVTVTLTSAFEDIDEIRLTSVAANPGTGTSFGVGIDDLTVGPPNTSGLPVTLIDFNAKVMNNETVKLEWTSAFEENNSYFDVQRSEDRSKFTSIAKIQGAGNSSLPQKYQTVDLSPGEGLHYYRLVQYDIDGKSQILGIKLIKIEAHSTGIEVYPNPAKSIVNISFQQGRYQRVDLIDINARTLYSRSITAGMDNMSFDLSGLPKAMYLIRMTGLDKASTSKWITKE